jgi:hypothetical protein
MPALSLAVEYNYAELAGGSYQLGGGAGNYAWNVRTRSVNLVWAKLNYRFNGLR